MIRFIKWFFSDTKKPIVEDHINVYSKLVELEEKYNALLIDVKRLEDENIETTNVLYELSNSLDAVDARIDILTAEKWLKDDDV
jgi:uncharacterized small protein (DUF1192 family)